MSTNNTNIYTLPDGTIDCNNPRVCAALTDSMGMLLTGVLASFKNNPALLAEMDESTKVDLDVIYRTMQMFRNSIGVDQDWYGENQSNLIPEIMRQARENREKFTKTIIDAMISAGLPVDMIPDEFRPRPSVSDSAAAILNSLRSDGVIG
jgi:hypothetical protein